MSAGDRSGYAMAFIFQSLKGRRCRNQFLDRIGEIRLPISIGQTLSLISC